VRGKPEVDAQAAPARLASVLGRAMAAPLSPMAPREVGMLLEVEQEVAWVTGLPGAGLEELLYFSGNRRGMAFNLDRDRIGVILIDDPTGLQSGDEVRRSRRVMDVPVGNALLGRVIDPTGRPLDGRGPIRSSRRLPVERNAAAVLARSPVSVPLHTGIKVVDALVPIGRGQRELIIGDRQTGKTAIAVDTILNQKGNDVSSVYCAIGQRSSAIARVISELRERGVMDQCCVVATSGDDQAGIQFIAPYAATTIAECFAEEGRDALVVYDDLTRHARAYRELSLLLRRPPGREAYPGDIFYIHARLLERATHLRDGGSLTALPIIETEAENISAYIPTNLISITDGQIYLSPKLFRAGVLPAVDVGRSVSRVGGDAQLPAQQAVAGDLRIRYSQFQELEQFSRYGTRLDAETRAQLERGRRVREVLRQDQGAALSPMQQLASLFAASEGLLDEVAVEHVSEAETALLKATKQHLDDIAELVEEGATLSDAHRKRMRKVLSKAIEPHAEGSTVGQQREGAGE
jgi:F-type H+-transporting ATPase subunit alpha